MTSSAWAWWRHPHPADDLELLVGRRVVDDHLHQEPVALGLRQGVDPFGFDRVLGGEHEERFGHGVGLPADGHLVLTHHLQERRLDLRRCTVDLVGEDEVGEYRAELHVELLARAAVDARAGDVGREQVGGELDPGERPTSGFGQCADREGLRQSRRTFQQAVPTGHQRDEESLDHPLLADDHASQLHQRSFETRRLVTLGHSGTPVRA